MEKDSYWEQRSREREAEWTNISKETIEKELAQQYANSLQRIQNEINALYGRFSRDNSISIAEAQNLIRGDEFRVWRMDIADYVRKIKASGDKKLLRELNVLAMRSRISRLDKLYGDTLRELVSMGIIVEDKMTEFLTKAYQDNYYHTRYDLGIVGIGIPRNLVDSTLIAKVLANPWSGKNYSSRIWKNTERLAKVIKREVTNGIHRGLSIDKMAKHVQETMESGRKEAVRLVRTEMNYANNQASLDSIKDAEMPYYQFIAVIDGRTSHVCKSHHEEVYKVEEAVAGVNLPPLHANCRSTISGTLKGYDTAKEKMDNKITLFKTMSYEDYYRVYIRNDVEYGMERNYLPPTVEFIANLAKKQEQPYNVVEKMEANIPDIFYDDNGEPVYPPSDGAIGAVRAITLLPGQLILDRYGHIGGRFFSVKGTPFSQRAMPRASQNTEYHTYRILKPLDVTEGLVAPWFGEEGLGIQYKSEIRIKELLKQGIIEEVE
ncbi:minor capsid protein [Veillonella intestinalis]|uniref:minor capsid protein n=1 Tax=Veillonella intestinalis TaxID=2941341 RepID=UPI00203BBE5B|nr:minor capsid protein [Veillonella intestinalis]